MGRTVSRTRAKNISILKGFFEWAVAARQAARRPGPADPATQETRRPAENILAAIRSGRSSPTTDRRDRLALHLLLRYGLRKGALRASSSATSTTHGSA